MMRLCPNCRRKVEREEMEWIYDCHGIPFQLVCYDCAEKMTKDNGYAGAYYSEADEQIDDDY